MEFINFLDFHDSHIVFYDSNSFSFFICISMILIIVVILQWISKFLDLNYSRIDFYDFHDLRDSHIDF